MQRKASARWQGTTQEGSGTVSVQSGTLQGRSLLVQGALRRRQGHEPRGARRRRPRRLFHDGAVLHAQQRGLHRVRHRNRGAAHDGPGRRQADDHRHPPSRPRAGARHRAPRNSRRSRPTPRSTASSRARSLRRSPSRWTRRCRPDRSTPRGGRRPSGQRPGRDLQSGESLPPRSSGRRWTTAGKRRRGAWRRRRPGRRCPAAAQDRRADHARAHDHQPQRFARHSVHAVDQPLPGLRARLHLLLRAADARVSRPLARPRLRDQALRQAQRRRPPRARSSRSPATAASRSRSAPTPTRTSRSNGSGRSPARSSR